MASACRRVWAEGLEGADRGSTHAALGAMREAVRGARVVAGARRVTPERVEARDWAILDGGT